MRNLFLPLYCAFVRIIIMSADRKKEPAFCTPEPHIRLERSVEMLGDCHIHMVLDGIYYKKAMDRHRVQPDDGWIRATLSAYRAAGITFLRDGGDAFGAGKRAAALAPEYGIDYRTPIFPIYRRGHYGAFIGRGFDTRGEFCALVDEVRRSGGDFIKIMISGLMDFDRYGVLTDTPLSPAEIQEMIAVAHDAGLAVMAHANGADTVRAALRAGVDSVEHGSYMDDECLHALAESNAVWVPTAVTVGNLRGGGRFDEAAVERILCMQLQNIAAAHRYGACIALGSDAGAWRVLHTQGALDEYRLLCSAMGDDADASLRRAEATIRERFRRP